MFPGVYSRVSSQYQWIRDTVCEHTTVPPEVFDCGEASGSGVQFPLLEGDYDKSKTYVTLEVSLDEQPEETSWMVTTLSGQPGHLVATVPPNFYAGYTNYTFHHRIEVEPDQFYRLSLRDSFGDGLKGYAAVYRGSVPILSNLITYENLFVGSKKVDHAFFTGKEPLSYYSLVLQFDKFPKVRLCLCRRVCASSRSVS